MPIRMQAQALVLLSPLEPGGACGSLSQDGRLMVETSAGQRPLDLSSSFMCYTKMQNLAPVSKCTATTKVLLKDGGMKGVEINVGLCNLPLVRIGNSHLGVAESSFVSQSVGVTFGNCGSIWDD